MVSTIIIIGATIAAEIGIVILGVILYTLWALITFNPEPADPEDQWSFLYKI